MTTRRFTPLCLLAFTLTVAACASAGEPVESSSGSSPTVTWDSVTLAEFDACFATGLLLLGHSQGPGRAHIPAPDDSITHQVTALYPFQLHVNYQDIEWNTPQSGSPTASLPFSCHSNDPAFSSDSTYVEFSSGELKVELTTDGNLQQVDVAISDDALAPSSSAAPSPTSPPASPSASASEPSIVDPLNFLTTDVNGLGYEIYAFSTPSGLHSCVIAPFSEGSAPASASCLVAFDDGVVEASDFGLVMPYLDVNGAQTIVVSDTTYMALDSSQVLDYGATLHAHGISCSVAETGITCTSGSHSFSASARHLELN